VNTAPRSFLIFPKTAFLRYFGMIFALPCGMVQVMLLRHEDLLVGLAVPHGDPSQQLTLMLNCR
jgi:hypothetical protein